MKHEMMSATQLCSIALLWLPLSACCISELAVIQLCRSCAALSSNRSYSSSGGDPPSVLAEQVGKVMKITLNRPAVLNAQTAEMGDRLTEIIGDIGGREAIQ